MLLAILLLEWSVEQVFLECVAVLYAAWPSQPLQLVESELKKKVTEDLQFCHNLPTQNLKIKTNHQM